MEPKQHEDKQCIIEFQAFRDNHDKFIVKELVIFDLSTNVPYSFVFKPPYAFKHCNTKSKRTNKWLTNHYHYINWSDGNVDFCELDGIMRRFCSQFKTIFTTGTEKVTWISKFTNNPVVNLTFSKNLKTVHVSPVCINITNCNHRISSCSLAKVYKLSLQMKQYSSQE